MIHPQTIAEHSFQSFGYLGSQGDFGQQVKHLLTSLQYFLYQVDIYFGLATGSHAMQHAHTFLRKAVQYAIERPPLCVIECIQLGCLGSSLFQSSGLVLIHLEDAFFHQSVKCHGRCGRFFQQCLLGYLLQTGSFFCPSGQLNILHQQGQLFLRPMQIVEQEVHPFFSHPLIHQTDTRLCTGLVIAFQLFLNEDSLLVQQRLHNGKNLSESCRLLQLSDALYLINTQ